MTAAAILLILWQTPQNIIGGLLLGICKVFGGATLIGVRDNCRIYHVRLFLGAISLGNIVLSSTAADTTIAHELGHAQWSRYLGPLYLLVIGLPSIVWAALYDRIERNFGGRTYYDFFTEKMANAAAGLCVLRSVVNPMRYILIFADAVADASFMPTRAADFFPADIRHFEDMPRFTERKSAIIWIFKKVALSLRHKANQ